MKKCKQTNKISEETKQLMRKRREWKHNNSPRNQIEYTELCKTARKRVRERIRQSNYQLIQTTIENDKSIKKMKQQLITSKKRLLRIKKKDGSTTSHQREILERIKEFYSTLYDDSIEQATNDSTVKIDVSEVLPAEVQQAIRNLKNGKTAGQGGITVEILKVCGDETYSVLADLFTRCLKQRNIPTSWKDAKVTVLHKKGDQEDLKNYEPISLLSIIYKLITKIITKRLETTLDHAQPIEQAEF